MSQFFSRNLLFVFLYFIIAHSFIYSKTRMFEIRNKTPNTLYGAWGDKLNFYKKQLTAIPPTKEYPKQSFDNSKFTHFLIAGNRSPQDTDYVLHTIIPPNRLAFIDLIPYLAFILVVPQKGKVNDPSISDSGFPLNDNVKLDEVKSKMMTYANFKAEYVPISETLEIAEREGPAISTPKKISPLHEGLQKIFKLGISPSLDELFNFKLTGMNQENLSLLNKNYESRLEQITTWLNTYNRLSPQKIAENTEIANALRNYVSNIYNDLKSRIETKIRQTQLTIENNSYQALGVPRNASDEQILEIRRPDYTFGGLLLAKQGKLDLIVELAQKKSFSDQVLAFALKKVNDAFANLSNKLEKKYGLNPFKLMGLTSTDAMSILRIPRGTKITYEIINDQLNQLKDSYSNMINLKAKDAIIDLLDSAAIILNQKLRKKEPLI